MKLKLPPRVKVLEALSAVSDGRINQINDKNFIVISSDSSRKYNVFVDVKNRKVSSTDNGTLYRNYIGYPIIAVLMLKGFIPYNDKMAKALRGINWRKLNEFYKSYALVEKHIKSMLKSKGIEAKEVDNYIALVMNILSKLNLIKVSR